MALCGLSLQLWWAEAILHCGAWAFTVAASLGRASVVAAGRLWGVELSSCGAGRPRCLGHAEPPWARIEPAAVAGRFLSLCHQGSPHPLFLESPYRLYFFFFFFCSWWLFLCLFLLISFPDSAASAVIWVHKEALLAAAWLLIYFLGELWPNGGNRDPITALLFTLLSCWKGCVLKFSMNLTVSLCYLDSIELVWDAHHLSLIIFSLWWFRHLAWQQCSFTQFSSL